MSLFSQVRTVKITLVIFALIKPTTQVTCALHYVDENLGHISDEGGSLYLLATAEDLARRRRPTGRTGRVSSLPLALTAAVCPLPPR